ncbi:DUF6098 family protein [Streptomyces sp. NPDC101206]|uniref:DUF6098 family protein n=1 Tax=Streptomyces sp. NPDC101206 TaxID=3366128 RepID=UPI00380AF473
MRSSRPGRRADRTARPWLLAGTEAGRVPDDEPLVRDVQPLGWIDPPVLAEAETEIEHQPGWWGPWTGCERRACHGGSSVGRPGCVSFGGIFAALRGQTRRTRASVWCPARHRPG